MANPLQKIWEIVRCGLPEKEFYKTLEVHYYPNSDKLNIAVFYTKRNLSEKLIDNYFVLKEQSRAEISLAAHSIQYHINKPIYSAYSKGNEKFLIYQIEKFYLYTKDEDMGEISITPYPEQIIFWAEDWRKGLNPKEEVGLILINTIIEKIKRNKR